MKKILHTLLVILLAAGTTKAQFSPFNKVVNINISRGASPTNDSTANGGANVFYESPDVVGSAGRFFPNITDGSYKLKALCFGNGLFNLNGNAISITNTNTSTNLAKYSVYNIDGANAVVKFKFTLDLTNYSGNNGSGLIMAFGNNTGGLIMTNNTAPFTTATTGVFGAFRAIFTNGSYITQYRSADGTTALTTAKALIKPNVSQVVEIFANSSAGSVGYRYRPTDTSDSTLASNTYHVYINGEKHVENFPKVGTSYVQTTINAIAITLGNANGQTAETVKISDLQVTYPAATLPISLTSFTGEKTNNGIHLNWSTASELNNDHFNILRSSDGKSFNKLTSVLGKGNSNQINNYSYLDNAPEAGINYYKLQQVDNDGTTTTADIVVAVNSNLNKDTDFKLSFNDNALNATFNSGSSGDAFINIYDLSGRTIFTKSFIAQKGFNNLSFDLPLFNKGIFVATLSQNGVNQSLKFVK